MRRASIGPGRKSLDRGSTFAGPPPADPKKTTTANPAAKRLAVSAASPAQRAKVRNRRSIVSGEGPCDPAHLWPRGRGGCDDPDCVIALTRSEHRAFDQGGLDVLPAMLANGCWEELAHLVAVHHVDPIGVLRRLTGERWAPASAGATAKAAADVRERDVGESTRAPEEIVLTITAGSGGEVIPISVEAGEMSAGARGGRIVVRLADAARRDEPARDAPPAR